MDTQSNLALKQEAAVHLTDSLSLGCWLWQETLRHESSPEQPQSRLPNTTRWALALPVQTPCYEALVHPRLVPYPLMQLPSPLLQTDAHALPSSFPKLHCLKPS